MRIATTELAVMIKDRKRVLEMLRENLALLKDMPEKYAELEDIIKRREATIRLQEEILRRQEKGASPFYEFKRRQHGDTND